MKKLKLIVVLCISILILGACQRKDIEEPVFHNIPDYGWQIPRGEIPDWDSILSDVKVTDNITENMDYELDDSEIDVDIAGEYYLFLTATDEAGNQMQAMIPIDVIEEDSDTYIAYNNAVNLTFSQLTIGNNRSYNYGDIRIIESEIKWLEDGAIYRSLATGLEGFYISEGDFYGMWGGKVVPVVFSFERPATWEEMKPYVDEVTEYIVPEQNAIDKIMNKFSKVQSIDGTFDFENRIFEFEIADHNVTAEEMQITGEMLGYILAALEEYAPTTDMQPNSYSFSLDMNR